MKTLTQKFFRNIFHCLFSVVEQPEKRDQLDNNDRKRDYVLHRLAVEGGPLHSRYRRKVLLDQEKCSLTSVLQVLAENFSPPVLLLPFIVSDIFAGYCGIWFCTTCRLLRASSWIYQITNLFSIIIQQLVYNFSASSSM